MASTYQLEPGSDHRGVTGMSADGRKPRSAQKSAIANGSRLLPKPDRRLVRPSDGRSAFSRRFRDVLAQIVCDLGGPDALSEAQRQLARRAATISIMCEKLEGEAAAGVKIDLNIYGTMTDRLGRCLQRLGIRRQARDIGPTLSDILRSDPQHEGDVS